jgi:hypothetical protein
VRVFIEGAASCSVGSAEINVQRASAKSLSDKS